MLAHFQRIAHWGVGDEPTRGLTVGTGKLLSKASYEAMTAPNLLGFGSKQPNCVPSCFTQIPAYNYGIGVVRSGNWIVQNSLLAGYRASTAYLPSERLAVSVAVTYAPGAFHGQGNYGNASDTVWCLIAGYPAPHDAPVLPKS